MRRDYDDARTAVRYDIGSTAIYVGYAEIPPTENQAQWTIKKITLDGSGNPVKSEWTTSGSGNWTDRTSEVYA